MLKGTNSCFFSNNRFEHDPAFQSNSQKVNTVYKSNDKANSVQISRNPFTTIKLKLIVFSMNPITKGNKVIAN